MEMSKFHPINDLLLIQLKDGITDDETGIILQLHQNKDLDRPTKGICLKQGKKVKTNFVNKEVFFEQHRGADIKNDEGWFTVIPEEQILGYRP